MSILPIESGRGEPVTRREVATLAISTLLALSLTTYGLKELTGSYRWFPASAITTLLPFAIWGNRLYQRSWDRLLHYQPEVSVGELDGKSTDKIAAMMGQCEARSELNRLIDLVPFPKDPELIRCWLRQKKRRIGIAPESVVAGWHDPVDRYHGYRDLG